MRYYEDLELDRWQESEPHTVTADEIVEFGSRYDPQYFHADREAAKESRFREAIASGIQIMAIWRVLDHRIAHDIAWICGIAWDNVRFPKALHAGDTVRARAVCRSRRPSDSDPTRGVVVFDYELRNQHDDIVWSCTSTNLIEMRDAPPGAHRIEYPRRP
jgi:acyl dehydratase